MTDKPILDRVTDGIFDVFLDLDDEELLQLKRELSDTAEGNIVRQATDFEIARRSLFVQCTITNFKGERCTKEIGHASLCFEEDK